MLQPTDKVLMGRPIFPNDRCAPGLGIIDRDIDLIAPERKFAGDVGWCGSLIFRSIGRNKIVGMFEDVLLHRFEISRHVGKVVKAAANVGEETTDDTSGGVPGQLPHRVTVLAFPTRYLANNALELGLERRDLVADALAIFRRQTLKRVGRHYFAILDRGKRQARRRPQQADALGLCLAFQSAERLVLAMLELLINNFAPRTVVFPLERGGEHDPQLRHETLHRIAQWHRATGGQSETMWTSRITEIVDVAPIWGHRLARCVLLQQLLNERSFAAAVRSKGKDIETRPLHGNAELDRFYRALLANETGK
jgi:hypothetical protein